MIIIGPAPQLLLVAIIEGALPPPPYLIIGGLEPLQHPFSYAYAVQDPEKPLQHSTAKLHTYTGEPIKVLGSTEVFVQQLVLHY